MQKIKIQDIEIISWKPSEDDIERYGEKVQDKRLITFKYNIPGSEHPVTGHIIMNDREWENVETVKMNGFIAEEGEAIIDDDNSFTAVSFYPQKGSIISREQIDGPIVITSANPLRGIRGSVSVVDEKVIFPEETNHKTR